MSERPQPDRHQPSGGARRTRQAPLYDLDIPTPTHAERAMTLAASVGDAVLSTLSGDPPSHPYGSLVLFALFEREPVFLISGLAEHTKNLRRDPRCSLLVRESGPKNPLALGRLTLVGRCGELEGAERDGAREAFLVRQPEARFYADFKDFGFWRLRVESARYIGGFGRMSWLEIDAWGAADPDPIAPHAAGIIAHMNDDHVEAMRLYCEAFSRAGAVEEVSMTGVDRYGFEMSALTEGGRRPVRVAFDAPAADAMGVRREMVALVKRARAQLGRG